MLLCAAVLFLPPLLVAAPGDIATIAGDGTRGYGGDHGPAILASLNLPYTAVVDSSGNIYISDMYNHRIRKVDTGGTMTTLAGNGTGGYSGDGGQATEASLYFPVGMAVDGSGNLYIADRWNHRVRKVEPSGTITTVAGNGEAGHSGDNGPATEASLSQPTGVAVDASGNLYIADYDNNRIRKVDPFGIITTVAGNGAPGYSGDGGPATSASLNMPSGVTVDPSGDLYIGDYANDRIRKVSGPLLQCTGQADGTPCDDGDCCTIGDACLSGECHGTRMECDDGNPCTDDYCDSALCVCYHVPRPDGSLCDDGDCCTIGDACLSGECHGTLMECDDGNPCTDDYCDSVLCVCVHVPLPEGTPCDDGLICTINDVCTGGVCIGTHVPWDDGNPCTEDLCDPVMGVVHIPLPDGTPCDDGMPCTLNDVCISVVCTGTPVGPPTEVPNQRFASKTLQTWDPPPVGGPELVYDVVRGVVSEWPVGSGVSEECRASGISRTDLADADDPPASTSFWFLVRARTVCGTGSYGTGSGGTPRPSGACP